MTDEGEKPKGVSPKGVPKSQDYRSLLVFSLLILIGQYEGQRQTVDHGSLETIPRWLSLAPNVPKSEATLGSCVDKSSLAHLPSPWWS